MDHFLCHKNFLELQENGSSTGKQTINLNYNDRKRLVTVLQEWLTGTLFEETPGLVFEHGIALIKSGKPQQTFFAQNFQDKAYYPEKKLQMQKGAIDSLNMFAFSRKYVMSWLQ